jgi:hypothetical protein
MTRIYAVLIATAALLGAAVFVYSQAPVRKVPYPAWETRVVTPREIAPARYAQVQQRDLDMVAADGWDLVAVAPYVLLNEARGTKQDTVTQTYPAYYFKRLRPDR